MTCHSFMPQTTTSRGHRGRCLRDTVHLLLFLALLTQLCQSSRTRVCRTRRTLMLLTMRDCAEKRLLSRGCEGHCTSYLQVEFTQEGYRLHKSCHCCVPKTYREVQVPVNCLGGQRVVSFSVPTECICRPCFADVPTSEIVPSELSRNDDGLRFQGDEPATSEDVEEDVIFL